MTAVILDRPRHADIIRECREAGVRIRLISDGDVGAAIEVAKDGAPVDILLGIGGTPEGAALHGILGSGRFCCRLCSWYLPARPQVVRGVQEVRQSTKYTKTLQSFINLSSETPCSSPASMHPVPHKSEEPFYAMPEVLNTAAMKHVGRAATLWCVQLQ